MDDNGTGDGETDDDGDTNDDGDRDGGDDVDDDDYVDDDVGDVVVAVGFAADAYDGDVDSDADR
eukprot:4351932-Pyramimonas_sp.AAC.1